MEDQKPMGTPEQEPSHAAQPNQEANAPAEPTETPVDTAAANPGADGVPAESPATDAASANKPASADKPATTEPPASDRPPAGQKSEPAREPDEVTRLREQLSAANARVIHSAALAAAARAGMTGARAAYALKLAELPGNADAEDLDARMDQAIGKVLEDVPELRGAVTIVAGSTGDHPRISPMPRDAWLDGFSAR